MYHSVEREDLKKQSKLSKIDNERFAKLEIENQELKNQLKLNEKGMRASR